MHGLVRVQAASNKMKVKAKCITRAFDNQTSVLFEPGEFYDIEHDGPLASLKIGERFIRFDKEGKPVGDPIGGKYVFEFDRAAVGAAAVRIPAAVKEIEPPDPEAARRMLDFQGKYTCKKCGKSCESLNELGTHSRSAHREEEQVETEAPELEASVSE